MGHDTGSERSFITDSDASAEPFEDPNMEYNPATYGLSPDSLIKERYLVEYALNAAYQLDLPSLVDIKMFNFIIHRNLTV
ncbi:hypothetical protein FRC10_006059, partial [Ceratobasidium sp. 414]